jgi:hypothetical protein
LWDLKLALKVTQISFAFTHYLKGIEVIGRIGGGDVFFLAELVSTLQ